MSSAQLKYCLCFSGGEGNIEGDEKNSIPAFFTLSISQQLLFKNNWKSLGGLVESKQMVTCSQYNDCANQILDRWTLGPIPKLQRLNQLYVVASKCQFYIFSPHSFSLLVQRTRTVFSFTSTVLSTVTGYRRGLPCTKVQ